MLYIPAGPLKFAAIDIFEILVRTRSGNGYVLIYADRYIELARAIPDGGSKRQFMQMLASPSEFMYIGYYNSYLPEMAPSSCVNSSKIPNSCCHSSD